MVRRLTLTSALLVTAVSFPSSGLLAQTPPRCLHAAAEQPAEKTRREQALAVAAQITRAEAMFRGPQVGPQPGPQSNFAPLARLTNVPATPAGFTLQFQLDGPRYMFSLKDTRDPCGYAIFSDQDRSVYEAMPQLGVKIVPADVP
jgi:hypothetical protein